MIPENADESVNLEKQTAFMLSAAPIYCVMEWHRRKPSGTNLGKGVQKPSS